MDVKPRDLLKLLTLRALAQGKWATFVDLNHSL